MKTDQRSNDDEKQVNKVVNNVKRWTGGHGFTSGVSQIAVKWAKRTQGTDREDKTGQRTTPNVDQIWVSFGEKMCPPRTFVRMRNTVGAHLCPFGQKRTESVHMGNTVGGALNTLFPSQVYASRASVRVYLSHSCVQGL